MVNGSELQKHTRVPIGEYHYRVVDEQTAEQYEENLEQNLAEGAPAPSGGRELSGGAGGGGRGSLGDCGPG